LPIQSRHEGKQAEFETINNLIENVSFGSSAKNFLPESDFIDNGVSRLKRGKVAERILPHKASSLAYLVIVFLQVHADIAPGYHTVYGT
jgi:hypothetical protein